MMLTPALQAIQLCCELALEPETLAFQGPSGFQPGRCRPRLLSRCCCLLRRAGCVEGGGAAAAAIDSSRSPHNFPGGGAQGRGAPIRR